MAFRSVPSSEMFCNLWSWVCVCMGHIYKPCSYFARSRLSGIQTKHRTVHSVCTWTKYNRAEDRGCFYLYLSSQWSDRDVLVEASQHGARPAGEGPGGEAVLSSSGDLVGDLLSDWPPRRPGSRQDLQILLASVWQRTHLGWTVVQTDQQTLRPQPQPSLSTKSLRAWRPLQRFLQKTLVYPCWWRILP